MMFDKKSVAKVEGGTDFLELQEAVSSIRLDVIGGRLVMVNGSIVKAELPGAEIGELCELRDPDLRNTLRCEVIGLDGKFVFLAPFGSTAGLSIGTIVTRLGHTPSVMVGDHVLGSVVDSMGEPLINQGLHGKKPRVIEGATLRSVHNFAPNPLSRPRITKHFAVGIRAIDGLISCGCGQRVGIFGSAGTGKSTLITDIVTKAKADIVVVGLIGERGREVTDFVKTVMDGDHGRRTVVVTATSDRPPVERVQAALTATTFAEHFRSQGKRVLLIIDSVTRLARALRDIGLAAGEPPARRGFPPSVFRFLPQLFERAGNDGNGSITAFYTVLVEGDINDDPVAEEVKSLLDGHIILSNKLADAGHYPAIDVLESKSRIASALTDESHRKAAHRIRELISKYKEIELLVQIGEYKMGSDATADQAIAKRSQINSFLVQDSSENTSFATTFRYLMKLAR
jgi:ATP synthase in type III secretion protein N